MHIHKPIIFKRIKILLFCRVLSFFLLVWFNRKVGVRGLVYFKMGLQFVESYVASLNQPPLPETNIIAYMIM